MATPDVVFLFDVDNTLLDDKLRILTAMKEIWEDRLTSVWVRQGHYALDPQAVAMYPRADLTLERIGDLVSMIGLC